MPRLLVAQLEAETPVVGIPAAEAGQHAAEAAELHRGGLGERLRSDECRRLKLASEQQHVVERAVDARGGRAAKLGLHPEGIEQRGVQVLGERHLGSAGDVLGESLEACVGVDPPLSRPRDRRIALEGETGRVREQMPDCRAFGAGRLVEVEDSLLRRDQHGERNSELRHRRPAQLHVAWPMRGDHLAPTHDPGRGVLGFPGVDLTQGVHAARY